MINGKEESGRDMDINIEQILTKQRKFFETGKTRTYAFRKNALERLSYALEEYEEDWARALKIDLSKSPAESYMAEIGMVKAELNYIKKNLSKWMKAKRVKVSASQFPAKSFVMYEPYGVVLIMAPWNYPLLLCLEPLIDAIAAGNCVILKPSAYAGAVSAALKKILGSIFPEEFVAVTEGGREINESLLEQRFDYIFCTGGVTVGRLVLEKAARHLTPVTLELGGKSPCIVDDTADVELAARRIAFGKILNAGQTCVAPDYLLVHSKVKDKLLSSMCLELEKMLGKSPLNNTDYPSIVNEKHFQRILHLIEGEKVVIGGGYNEEIRKIEPTLLDGITLESPVMQEEIFGPVLPVLTFETRDDLKDIISSFEKPLAFYLFSRNKKMQSWILETFSFGGGCINDTIMHLTSPYMPFGGVGKSGMGGYHGKTGFDTFSHKKSVVKRGSIPDIPLRYHPYSKAKDRVLRIFLK